MSRESPTGSNGALTPPPACSHDQEQQTSNPAPTPVASAMKRARYAGAKQNVAHEPQTIVLQERLAAAAATPFAAELQAVSVLAEKEPILEGLEAYAEADDVYNHFSGRNAKSAPTLQLQEREVCAAFPFFPAENAPSQEASSVALAAPLASAPAAFPQLEYTHHKNKQLKATSPDKKEAYNENKNSFKIPSALLFAAASQLYHTTSSNAALRVSAAAHFMNLALQANPDKVASWKDICAWGSIYGIKAEDLRAAVSLVGKEAIILDS